MKNSPTNVDTAAAADASAQPNLLEVAACTGTFNTFGKAVEMAGLTDTLSGTGPFTVFAPTDKAFEQLPAGRLEMLLKPENKAELISILNYHVIAGRKSAAELGKWTAARTVSGLSAPIEQAGEQVLIDGAQLTSVDMQSSNGVLHGIDKVNVPTQIAPPITTAK